MLIIAHRGFSSHYTENTLVSFTQALLLDIDAIELDIHQVENEFMVFHDPFIDKLTDSKGRIFDMPLDEVRGLLVKGRDPIPTLSEVATLVGNRVTLNVEVKTIQCVQTFVSYLSDIIVHLECKVVISSFDHPLLSSIKNAFDYQLDINFVHAIEYGALIAHTPYDHAKYTEALDVSIAAIDWNVVTPDFVDDAHRRGKKVWCYTVNHEQTLRELLQMGVDGIFTDRPDWARAFLKTQLDPQSDSHF